MSEKTNSRRKLLKSIAAGSGAVIAGHSLPEKWARPVVDSVLLPTHAMTSLVQYTTDTTSASLEDNSLFAHAVNSLIPEAAAGDPDVGKEHKTCATQNPDGSFKIEGLFINEDFNGATVSALVVLLGGDPVDANPVRCQDCECLGKIKVGLTGIFDDGGTMGGYYLVGGAENRYNFHLKLGACSAPACPVE